MMKNDVKSAVMYLLLLGLFVWLHILFFISSIGCLCCLLAAGAVAGALLMKVLCRQCRVSLLIAALIAGMSLSLFARSLALEYMAAGIRAVSPADAMVYVSETEDGGLNFSPLVPSPDRQGRAVAFSPLFSHRLPALLLSGGLSLASCAFALRLWQK